ncbi:MAG: 2-oxoacid:acceptor oxidoreductase family protein [Proteocatella sp.]|nr:2-oxoacid:acceptor oxidoreductase family protein [Proteocatella sp.]
MENKVICAGFGGQGVMSMGQLLAYAGMIEDKHVSWLPSYGPEMRGGTANCGVTVSDEEIGSPIITNDADIAIVMNLPSLIKFEKDVKPGGKIFVNSSLIEKKVERTDIEVYYIDANKIAADIGNIKAANLVMLGAVLKSTPIVDIESILEAFKKVFGPSKEKFIPQNREALVKGGESI